jgi:hypothetical protein
VRLWTRIGHDWSSRDPHIVGPALRHRLDSFVFDGEAVLFGVISSPELNGLHNRKHHDEIQLHARRVDTKRIHIEKINGPLLFRDRALSRRSVG